MTKLQEILWKCIELEAEQAEPHEFSEEFEEKMRALLQVRGGSERSEEGDERSEGGEE